MWWGWATFKQAPLPLLLLIPPCTGGIHGPHVMKLGLAVPDLIVWWGCGTASTCDILGPPSLRVGGVHAPYLVDVVKCGTTSRSGIPGPLAHCFAKRRAAFMTSLRITGRACNEESSRSTLQTDV